MFHGNWHRCYRPQGHALKSMITASFTNACTRFYYSYLLYGPVTYQTNSICVHSTISSCIHFLSQPATPSNCNIHLLFYLLSIYFSTSQTKEKLWEWYLITILKCLSKEKAIEKTYFCTTSTTKLLYEQCTKGPLPPLMQRDCLLLFW